MSASQRVLSGLLTAVLAGCGASPQACAPLPSAAPSRASLAVTVFCGPDPASPFVGEQVQALVAIGATATYGPCRTPAPGYLVNDPGQRYASPAEYLVLAAHARNAGLGVVAYDARFWGDEQARAAALADWGPYIQSGTLAAIDLGDEPNYVDMPEMNRRAQLARLSGVEPTTIFVGDGIVGQVLTESHRQVPLACPGTDRYENLKLAWAEARKLEKLAGCSVLAVDVTGRDLDGDGDGLSLKQITKAVVYGQRILLFGGLSIPSQPSWTVLVGPDGQITPQGHTVQAVLP